jgi:DedD protein
LLGIFFGLVLVCGVFFGFGYSMGRGMGSGGRAKAVEGQPAESAAEIAAAVNPPAPTPTVAPAITEQPDTPKAAPKATQAPIAHQETADDDAAAKPVIPVSTKPAPGKEAPAYVPPIDAPPSPAGKPMVQIAAVARQEDANVLVAALRQRGYGVVVRTEPQDKLLHVQVGPFADRGQASAMKQKLLSDGYNAIIKQ